jgi:uncharacterized protein YbaR (Trm112 family)
VIILIMLACPYCHRQTTIPGDYEIESIDIGRFTCDHCDREFLVIDNVPVIEAERKKAPKASR